MNFSQILTPKIVGFVRGVNNPFISCGRKIAPTTLERIPITSENFKTARATDVKIFTATVLKLTNAISTLSNPVEPKVSCISSNCAVNLLSARITVSVCKSASASLSIFSCSINSVKKTCLLNCPLFITSNLLCKASSDPLPLKTDKTPGICRSNPYISHFVNRLFENKSAVF